MTHLLAVLHMLDIYILAEVSCSFCFVVLYFILEAIAQDNVTAEGFKQRLLPFPAEETWLCERTSQCLLSGKSPLEGPGTVCCKTDGPQVREGQKYVNES